MSARDHFRAHARRRVDLVAWLRAPGAAAPQEVRLRDLSLGGACFEVDAAAGSLVERDGAISIEVTAPSLWDPLYLKGKIAWVRRGAQGRPTRAGMRFEHRESGAVFALFELLGAQAY